ncbi:MAG TPA: hypothetical protein VFM68_02480 [Candidatus Saccharimonadales bacterium]|nr:hypothetical protein [Candidatus Saccharimonadales bacterium]
MNEQYSHENEPVNLSPLEVRSLANQAKLQGERYDVDYADEQAKDMPQPYRYVLELDPAPLQAYKESLPNANLEVINKVIINYNEPYVINTGEAPLESTVSVSITSTISNDIDVAMSVQKVVDYDLPFNQETDSVVTESYFNEDGKHFGYMEGQDIELTLQQWADDRRPLNDDDLQLLRVIV